MVYNENNEVKFQTPNTLKIAYTLRLIAKFVLVVSYKALNPRDRYYVRHMSVIGAVIIQRIKK